MSQVWEWIGNQVPQRWWRGYYREALWMGELPEILRAEWHCLRYGHQPTTESERDGSKTTYCEHCNRTLP